MRESAATFNLANTARQYIGLYEKMLERPLINPLRVMMRSPEKEIYLLFEYPSRDNPVPD
jgi:hypothetical protein